jgi:hypothetical protein
MMILGEEVDTGKSSLATRATHSCRHVSLALFTHVHGLLASYYYYVLLGLLLGVPVQCFVSRVLYL